MIFELLKEGRENALSPDYLKTAAGLQSEREVRRQVEEERREGKVILSSMGRGGGYYKPANTEEVREFIRVFEARAKGTLFTLNSARRYLEEIEGQGKLDLNHEQDEDSTL